MRLSLDTFVGVRRRELDVGFVLDCLVSRVLRRFSAFYPLALTCSLR
jgi:hypothetical protein